jgi:hypothetical protein
MARRRALSDRRITVTTLPRMVASSPGIGLNAGLHGISQIWPSGSLGSGSFRVLTVACPSTAAAAISPFSALAADGPQACPRP